MKHLLIVLSLLAPVFAAQKEVVKPKSAENHYLLVAETIRGFLNDSTALHYYNTWSCTKCPEFTEPIFFWEDRKYILYILPEKRVSTDVGSGITRLHFAKASGYQQLKLPQAWSVKYLLIFEVSANKKKNWSSLFFEKNKYSS